MPLQMRLTPGSPLYSPDRDLAYCTPHLVHRAMKGLDPDNQEEWVKEYLTKEDVTTDDLCAAARSLAMYLNHTMLDPQYEQPFDALTAAGFFDLKPAVRIIVCAKLGQILISAFFSAMRDVVRDPNEPPVYAKQISSEVEELQKRIYSQTTK